MIGIPVNAKPSEDVVALQSSLLRCGLATTFTELADMDNSKFFLVIDQPP